MRWTSLRGHAIILPPAYNALQIISCELADLADKAMRYLVCAKVKAGHEASLLCSIESETLGEGSVAGDEYLRNMHEARLAEDGTVRWVEVCYCPTPLEEERPYWEEYFELVKVKDAHARKNCRDENGSEPWACSECDCTARLQERLCATGCPFLPHLKTLEGNTRDLHKTS